MHIAKKKVTLDKYVFEHKCSTYFKMIKKYRKPKIRCELIVFKSNRVWINYSKKLILLPFLLQYIYCLWKRKGSHKFVQTKTRYLVNYDIISLTILLAWVYYMMMLKKDVIWLYFYLICKEIINIPYIKKFKFEREQALNIPF